MVQRVQQHCFLADPLYFFGGSREPADVVDFTHNVLPSVDLNGQKDHRVATVTNATIGDDISILEELGNMSEQTDSELVDHRLTSTSCCWIWLRV